MQEHPSEDNLWNAIVAFQEYPFKTATGLPFRYKLKVGKDGKYNRELLIDRREKSKSLAFGDGEFFILRANGDSMTGAGINSGDMVVIRKQNTASDGDIVVALVENESTLKRFFLDTERRCVHLHPENPKYPEIYTQNCSIHHITNIAVNR